MSCHFSSSVIIWPLKGKVVLSHIFFEKLTSFWLSTSLTYHDIQCAMNRQTNYHALCCLAFSQMSVLWYRINNYLFFFNAVLNNLSCQPLTQQRILIISALYNLIRFVIPVVFINKLYWIVCTCLTQIYLMVEICIEYTFHFTTWRWPLSSAETCSCSLCSILYIYLYHQIKLC